MNSSILLYDSTIVAVGVVGTITNSSVVSFHRSNISASEFFSDTVDGKSTLGFRECVIEAQFLARQLDAAQLVHFADSVLRIRCMAQQISHCREI